MAGKKMTIGATGETAAATIKQVREMKNLTFAEMSRRLDAINWPIAPLGLKRIENCERRIDVDDLMALAIVLRVSPMYLLQPISRDLDDKVTATGLGEITVEHLSDWFEVGQFTTEDGVEYLPLSPFEEQKEDRRSSRLEKAVTNSRTPDGRHDFQTLIAMMIGPWIAKLGEDEMLAVLKVAKELNDNGKH